MKLKQARALFTSSDRAVCRDMEEQYQVDKDMRDLVSVAKGQGWEVEPTSNGKVMWKPADAEQSPVVTGVRLGNGRARQNAMAALKRAGLQIGPIVRQDDIVEATLNGQLIPTTQTTKVLAEAGAREDANMAKMLASVLEAINTYVGSTHTNCVDKLDEELLKECDALAKKIELHETQVQEMNKQRDLLEAKVAKLEEQTASLGAKVRDTTAAFAKEQERAHVAEQKLATLRSVFKED